MKSFFYSRVLSALLLASATMAAQAHNIWLEDLPTGEVGFRFGEIGEKIETSPGRLDAFTGLQGWTVATNQFKLEKKSGHILLQGSKATAPVLVEEAGMAVRAVQNPRKTMFYARWQPAKAEAGEAALTLDIVPTGKPGEYRVSFRGQPLAEAKIKVEGEKGFTADLTADAQGKVTFKAPSKGLFLLVCVHRETLAGFAGGKAYEGLTHSSTLSFRQP
ncbi:MAG: cobalt transporter substrate-binding protein [Verrucomicrobia bacterium]|nr:cobalt transporter substrate-binding protein [Verrucomicrobiota bacterium]